VRIKGREQKERAYGRYKGRGGRGKVGEGKRWGSGGRKEGGARGIGRAGEGETYGLGEDFAR